MGLINKIYSSSKTTPSSRMYSDHFTIERTENFHVHLRNLRIEMDKNEYRLISLGFIFGYIKWLLTGRKEKTPGENVFLFLDKVPNSPSLLNGFTTSNEIRVELQQWADFVHIHYKNIRLEFTVSEAKEFIETMSKGLQGIQDTERERNRIRRVGFNHRAVPSMATITGEAENSEFWTKWSDARDLDNPFLTTIVDGDDSRSVEEETRKTGLEGIFSFYIDDLYYTTLHKKTKNNSFGYEGGTFLPLQNRYDFAKKFIEQDFKMSDEEIRDTEYYKLLCNKINSTPRDGSPTTIYSDPMNQAQRYIGLIKSLSKNNINSKKEIQKYKETFGFSQQVRKDGKAHVHEGVNENNESAITCLALDTSIIVNDGLHRIACLKALKDEGLISCQTIDCFLINPKKIYGNSLSSRFYILFRNLKPRKVFGLGIEQKIKDLLSRSKA